MFSEAKSKVDLEIAFVELESAIAQVTNGISHSVVLAISPFFGCQCWWGCECDRLFFLWDIKKRSLSKIKCDRSFWDASAGGDESAIVLFRMSVLVGM